MIAADKLLGVTEHQLGDPVSAVGSDGSRLRRPIFRTRSLPGTI